MLRRIKANNFSDTDDEDEIMLSTPIKTSTDNKQSPKDQQDIKEDYDDDEDLSDFNEKDLDIELSKNTNKSNYKNLSAQQFGRISKKLHKKQELKKQSILNIIQKHIPHRNDQQRNTQYINKQRTLIFASRGINQRMRHLMNDLKSLLPTSKSEPKFNEKRNLSMINEICIEHNCNNCIFFESRRNTDLYLWITRIPNGPSCKFFVTNIHTCQELRLTGNHVRGSRPLLIFDEIFDDSNHPQLLLMKELLIQVFGTPKGHPHSKPFIDHVFSFMFYDHKIWFRNYQIVYNDEQKIRNVSGNVNGNSGSREPILVEIGPRFVLHPVKIQQGSFGGSTIYQNEYFLNPNAQRREMKNKKRDRMNKESDLYLSKMWNKIGVRDRKYVNEKAYKRRFSKSDKIYDEVWNKGLDFNLSGVKNKKRKKKL